MNPIDWKSVRRVLVVRLRSIGDTVLATPSLIALKRFMPGAELDILLEDWVAPLLEGFDAVDNVLTVGRDPASKLKTAWEIRRRRYDVAFNLHGGTTGTFFTCISGAPHRVGYAEYQYSFLYDHLLSSAADFWEKKYTHSAEQQLALLGFAGVPVRPDQRSRLAVTEAALGSVNEKLEAQAGSGSGSEPVLPILGDRGLSGRRARIALIHPTAAFATKTWPVENFARTAEHLFERGLRPIAVAAKNERAALDELNNRSKAPIITLDDLTLPEITALASRARLFVGNDSGIAHIAAAVDTPGVVIFGSSNIRHWRPWTDAPNEVVYHSLPCQPCPGYECREFGDPKCIKSVTVGSVTAAIERVLMQGERKGEPEGSPFAVVGEG